MSREKVYIDVCPEEDDDAPWASFRRVEGLDGTLLTGSKASGKHALILHPAVTPRPVLPRALPRWITLRVVAGEGCRLGEYRALLHAIEQSGDAPDRFLARVDLDPPAALGVHRLWPEWASGLPAKRDRWTRHDFELRMAWLEIVRFRDARPRSLARDVHLEGGSIEDYPSFFCALGEAIHGPGGFFGADLDSLDALSSEANGALRVHWHGSTASRRSLSGKAWDAAHDWREQREARGRGESMPHRIDGVASNNAAEDAALFDAIMDVFASRGVRVILD